MKHQSRFEVREVEWPEKTLLTKRVTTTMDRLPAFFSSAYVQLFRLLQTQGLSSGEPPFAIYYQVDETTHETDVAAAVSIHGQVKDLSRFQKITIPASRALQLTCYGAYSSMKSAYQTLEQYVQEHRLEILLMMEQYIKDPGTENDPAKWRTDIYYIIN